MALQSIWEQWGDDVTLLYDKFLLPSSMTAICEIYGKNTGGPWECYRAINFFGWEAERVVAVTSGLNMLEMATRAKTELCLICAKPEIEHNVKNYLYLQEDIEAAWIEGLVDVGVIELTDEIENTN